jgi:hypothetical protein
VTRRRQDVLFLPLIHDAAQKGGAKGRETRCGNNNGRGAIS